MAMESVIGLRRQPRRRVDSGNAVAEKIGGVAAFCLVSRFRGDTGVLAVSDKFLANGIELAAGTGAGRHR